MSDVLPRADNWQAEIKNCVNQLEQIKGSKLVQNKYLIEPELLEYTCYCMYGMLPGIPKP